MRTCSIQSLYLKVTKGETKLSALHASLVLPMRYMSRKSAFD